MTNTRNDVEFILTEELKPYVGEQGLDKRLIVNNHDIVRDFAERRVAHHEPVLSNETAAS